MNRFSSYGSLLALFALEALAKTVKVEVGESGNSFSPDNISADKGDVVEFHFNNDHDVIAGSFDDPCTPVSSGGFYSGTLPSGDNSYFSVTINDTNPIFIYCSVDQHCRRGMVGVINQGSDSLSSFKSAAQSSSNNETPDSPFGGTVSSSSEDSTSASTTSGTASESSAPSGSSTGSGSDSTTSASESAASASNTGSNSGPAGPLVHPIGAIAAGILIALVVM